MIVLHVVEPFAAGIAAFVRALTETMPDDLHIIVHGERKPVMSASEVKKSFPKKNVRFIRWHSAQRAINPLKDLKALSELYKILRRLKKKNLVDVVHLHSSKSGLLGRTACRLAGISNVIYTPNGASFLASKNKFATFFYQQLEKIGQGMGGQVVCCSQSEFVEYKKIGIPAFYINNGIKPLPVNNFQDEKHDKFRIITSGRIVHQKNPEMFNAIARYFEEFTDFEFIWAGDGEARKLLTSSNITITGWLNDDQVKSAVSGADLYLSTSHYEGLSFGILEALALQKAVLLSDCVGNRDMIRSRSNGDLFKNEIDAIVKILHYSNNRDMLQIMGDFSQKVCAEEFDQHQNFTTYRTIYASRVRQKRMMLAVNKLN